LARVDAFDAWVDVWVDVWVNVSQRERRRGRIARVSAAVQRAIDTLQEALSSSRFRSPNPENFNPPRTQAVVFGSYDSTIGSKRIRGA